MAKPDFEEDLSYPDLPDWVVPGAKAREFYWPSNPSNRLWHVRAIVDNRPIVRAWSKYKQRWHYEIQAAWWFDTDYVNEEK